jgi:hypothetical protein
MRFGRLQIPFADGRASLRTAVFYYDYTDLQVGFVCAAASTTVNAARESGIDSELPRDSLKT